MDRTKLEQMLQNTCNKDLRDASNEELYTALLTVVQELAKGKETNTGKKKLYYISAEFLIGKLLSNNLINLGIFDEVKEILEDNGKSLSAVEEIEPEPSLGNGGLGRLAACFLDSIATLGLNGDGIGLNYHFGLFKQFFKDNKQDEQPNPWMEHTSWLTRTDVSYEVSFKGFTLTSRMYDIEVTGYHNRTNKLHLFDVETVDESLVDEGLGFDKTDIKKNLTLFLYPDDSERAGQVLRIYQQYFMVSNGARLILEEALAKGSNLYDLPDYAVIQINDTHPTMVIPEIIRLLTTEHGMEIDDAIEVVRKTCAYTNHTILAEALEKWPMDFLEETVPQLIPIIEVLDNKVRTKFDDPSVAIIDKENRVHMAHIDIHYGFSVNGVAALHTEILKGSELNQFYRIYPEKFNNKTNGITFRRWLLYCNPELAVYISSFIGNGFKKDAMELEKLGDPSILGSERALRRLLEIKEEKKAELAKYLKATQNLTINPNSIYDIQIKRLHEYKRQQMNVLYLIHKYLEIKRGNKPQTPITAIFGAKAAPAYTIAKDIIHLILCLQQIIASDPQVKPYLNVVMVSNYNVTLAEKLIPACDISEQISLASKEASGTGNMKFMIAECVIIIMLFLRLQQKKGWKMPFSMAMSRDECKQYMNILVPILICEFFWSLGENVYTAIYGRIGTKSCAAMTLINPMSALFIGLMGGVASAAGILTGKWLGAKEYDDAYTEAKKMMWYGLAGSLVLSVSLVLLGKYYLGIFRVGKDVTAAAYELLLVFALIAPVKVQNMILGGGIVRSGGKTNYIMAVDLIGTWGVGVPLGLLSAFFWKLPITWVYLILSLEECVRLILTLLIFKKKIWMHRVTKHG